MIYIVYLSLLIYGNKVFQSYQPFIRVLFNPFNSLVILMNVNITLLKLFKMNSEETCF